MGTPKALMHDPDGTSWLRRTVSALRAGGCQDVTVVLGASADEAVVLLSDLDVHVVVAEGWAGGMAASLHAGLSALRESDASAAVIGLVDLPDVSAEVVLRVTATGAGEDRLARATYDGRPGHPVLIGRDHWPGVLESLAGDEGARSYLGDHEVTLVECGDLATGRDVDAPRSP